MKKAIVTGASSGIGKAISERLLAMGYGVTGVSRFIDETAFAHHNFQAIRCDLSDEKETLRLIQTLADEEVFILVNCAGFGEFAPHETLGATTIIKMSFLNLTAPMLLTNALLRRLKGSGGYLINITSIEALRSSRFSAVYSATKAGLKAFGDVLFEETRKSDLSVTNINPDMTQSDFFNKLHFGVVEDENSKLFAEDIADAIEHILTMRKGAVVSNYTVRSLHFGIQKG